MLDFWLDIANTYDQDKSLQDNAQKTNNSLDMLEGMLLIHNVFANRPLILKENSVAGTYYFTDM